MKMSKNEVNKIKKMQEWWYFKFSIDS